MRQIFILIISASIAVITVYAVWFALHLRRTLASVRDFTMMLDASLAPLLKEVTALSARINALSDKASGWRKSVLELKSSISGIVGALEALGALLALRNILASRQSKSRGMLTVMDFLLRR